MKDPYILSNGILKNKLGIKNEKELNLAEKDIVFSKLINVEDIEDLEYNNEILKQIHTHLFGDIFDWAGRYRTVPIYKEEIVLPGLSLEYSAPNEIERKINQKLEQINSCEWNNKNIKEISLQFTKTLAELWRIHPFRDGNTRTILTFANIFAKNKGINFDISTILENLTRKYDKQTNKIVQYSVRDKFVLAALDDRDCPEYEHLQLIIKQAIETKDENKKNNILEGEDR